MMLPEKYAFVRDILASLWIGEPDSVVLVRESANVVIRFEEVGGIGRFLRITNIWQQEKVLSAMDYLRFLHGQGAPVYEPIASVNGRFIEDFPYDNTTYMCRVYEEVQGEVLTNLCTDPVIYEAWGRAIAQLHEAASRYQPYPDLYFWSHEQELQETIEFLPPDDMLAWREYEAVMGWFNNMPQIDGGLWGVAR